MAVGDIVGTLTTVGGVATSFVLINNPGGFFSISGSNLIQAVPTPHGIFPITVKAIGPGYSATTSFSLDFTGDPHFPPPPPPPPPLTSAIAVAPSTLGAGQTGTVFFTWNDAVIDFTLGAVAVTNGSIDTLTQVSPTLFRAVFTPEPDIIATATLQVQQSGTGGAVYFNAAGSTTQASNIADVFLNTIVPVQEFFFGINLSGAENEFPVFPTLAQLQYWTQRGVQYFRIPFAWSKANSNGQTIGIQPTVFGPLDTTSFIYPLHGTNLLYNSELLASSPWQTFTNGSGTISVTANAGTDPNGGNTAALIALNRSDGPSQPVIFQNYAGAVPGTSTNSVYLKAATPSDVGRVVQMSLFADTALSKVSITLTANWVRYNTTGAIPSASRYAIQFGYLDIASTIGPTNLLAWGAQANAGSLAAYQSTVAGYVQALNDLMLNAQTTGAKLLMDFHNFAVGPGNIAIGQPGVPPSALADMWDKFSQLYGLNSALWGIDIANEPVNGFDVSTVISYTQLSVNAIRARGFTGPILVEGTNFTGVWNWVSGQGQPFNNANLNVISDPLNNLLYQGHGYFDRNSSGGFFAWQVESVTAGEAPPPISTSHDIGTLRLNREYLPWLAQNGLRGVYGEFGTSIDQIFRGGANDWADWIITARNTVDLCKANNIPVFLWGGGLGFGASYGFNPEPYSAATGVKDFSGAGVDSVLVAGLINHYVTNPQPQPTAYQLVAPQTVTPTGDPTAPIVTTNVYGTVGVATTPATIIYGGVVSPGAVITPHAKFSDGTDAGGTFTPATVPLTAGDNALAMFTYTPAATNTILISTTNNQGWTDPPAFVVSTQNDAYRSIPSPPTNLYGLYRRYTPYIGDALTLQRDDATVKSFAFTVGNNLDRVAIQAWAGKQSGINVLNWSDMSPQNADLDFTQTVNGSGSLSPVATRPTLTLQNAAGYPEIVVATGAGYFNMQVSGNAGVNGNQFSAYARMNQSGGASQGLWRTDYFTGPIVFGTGSVSIINAGFVGGNNYFPSSQAISNISFGVVNGAYHDYAFTYTAGVANGSKTYFDGSLSSQATPASSVVEKFTLTQAGTTATVSGYVGLGISMGDVIAGAGVSTGTVFVSQISGPTGGNGVYTTDLSGTASAAAATGSNATYTINAAFNSTAVNFGNFRFGSGTWAGSLTNFEMFAGYALTPTNISAITSADATYYSTLLPDTLPPIFIGVTNQNVVSATPATPFSTVILQDVAGTTDQIVFTLTGHAATLSGTGLTGSNPYTLTTDTVANINTKLQALQLTSTGSPGDVTNIAMVTTSSTGLMASANPTATIFAAANPVISGMVGPNVSQDQGAPPLWQVTVTDSNPTPTVSATITVTGSAGTLSNIGPYTPSGGGPYTFGAMTQTELTRALRNLLWLPGTTTVGTTSTFSLVVTNNFGLTASASNTITNVATAAMPSPFTPVATPGTLPRHYKGINFSGGEFNNPSSISQFPQYVTNPADNSWAASVGLDTIRLPFLFSYLIRTGPVLNQATSVFYQPFNSVDVASVRVGVENALQASQYIILDNHGFGSILNPFPTQTSDDAPFLRWVSDVRVPQSAFVDCWTRLLHHFNSYPNITLGLENEPGYSQATARALTTGVAASIRTFNTTVRYYPPTPSNVSGFDTTVWTGYTDPVGGPFLFDVHQYFDGNGGNLNTCRNIVPSAYFGTFTSWCRANSYTAVVSEFAYGTDSTCTVNPPDIDPGVPDYFTANADVYFGWNWWWSGNVPPSALFFLGSGATNAQLPSLTSNLSNTF